MRSISSPLPIRNFIFILLNIFCIYPSLAQVRSLDEYDSRRKGLLKTEAGMYKASIIRLTEEEKTAEKYLFTLKEKEIQRTTGEFPPSKNFLRVKNEIFSSPLFAVFKKMPKGAVLHAHPGAIGDFHWLIQFATYLPDCYLYTGPDNDNDPNGSMRFFDKAPSAEWKRISDLRAGSGNAKEFDENLYHSITLGTEDLDKPDIWVEFEKCFSRIDGLQSYEKVYSAWNTHELSVIANENVQLLELRSFLGGPCGFDQQGKGSDTAIASYKNSLDEVRKTTPDFQLRFIFTRMKQTGDSGLIHSMQEALRLRKQYPRWIAGFDLVGEEDPLPDLKSCVPAFLQIEKEARRSGISLPYYFHAGESNRTNNTNIVDAVILKSQRIGHGLAIEKHPYLMDLVKEKKIAIEVCPVSNQVLGYVADLRNHPAIHWLRSGIPVTINPDDPGMMGYTFSADFYEAFLAWDLSLSDLKLLAMNSINYSSLSEVEKKVMISKWKEKWSVFIQDLVSASKAENH
ncbi:MAG TPA: hypothetical protein PKL85_01990 [Bacteroidia bacterium]|nr:hypothetical protein [Bacteroidia bacterium]